MIMPLTIPWKGGNVISSMDLTSAKFTDTEFLILKFLIFFLIEPS